jgi:FeS assembly SUF system regulator
MLRLNRMTDYGLVVLSQMAHMREAVLTAPELADATGLPAPSVSKLLKRLAREHLVVSHRGVHGGYALAREAEKINAAQVIAALEGPVGLTACVDGVDGLCKVEISCPIRGRWDPINTAILHSLQGISLAELAESARFAPPASSQALAKDGVYPVGH